MEIIREEVTCTKTYVINKHGKFELGEIVNILEELEDTALYFKGLVIYDKHLVTWLKEEGIIEDSVRGHVAVKDEERRKALFDELCEHWAHES